MTTNNTDGAALLPVTQADRDASAALLACDLGEPLSPADHFHLESIRSGQADDDDGVQAFARHRISHSLPGDVGMREALIATGEAAATHAKDASALRERVSVLEEALWSVLSYDQLLRQYAGPQAILFAGDLEGIDATYDAMVAKITGALANTAATPSALSGDAGEGE